jgi:hypothetical protein
MSKSITFTFVILFITNALCSQRDTIRLTNPSFEDTPKRGGESDQQISGWYDCGMLYFPQESPPDIHPNGFWGVNVPAHDGKTYLGMVVRDNGTYEGVSAILY